MKINKKKIKYVIIVVFLFAIFCSLYNKFLSGYLESDFVPHTKDAKNGELYALAILIMRIAMLITNNYNCLISIFISIISLGTIIAIFLLMKYILNNILQIQIHYELMMFLSITLICICKICVPFLSPLFYIKSYVTQPWHNSTYICMRLCAIPTLLYFFKIQKHYCEYIDAKECVLFSVFLSITNYAKPNFVIVFAPIMLVVLIYDFIKTKTKSFKNAFIFGCCVLISCIVLIYQSSLLYSATDNNEIVIGLNNICELLFLNYHDIFNLLSSLAFPLLILILCFLKKIKLNNNFKRIYIESWCMFVLSILIRLFVYENGDRASHGNFAWSSYFFALVLFIVSLCLLIYLIKEKCINRFERNCALSIYCLHILSGVVYFILIYTNTTVFMT